MISRVETVKWCVEGYIVEECIDRVCGQGVLIGCVDRQHRVGCIDRVCVYTIIDCLEEQPRESEADANVEHITAHSTRDRLPSPSTNEVKK